MQTSNKATKINKTKQRFTSESKHNRQLANKALRMSYKQARHNKNISLSLVV